MQQFRSTAAIVPSQTPRPPTTTVLLCAVNCQRDIQRRRMPTADTRSESQNYIGLTKLTNQKQKKNSIDITCIQLIILPANQLHCILFRTMTRWLKTTFQENRVRLLLL